jgi:HAD superfamily hydrolase (TIGR01509 family)
VGVVAVGRVNAAEVDAVTLDAYGTLVTLADPIPALSEALDARGVARPRDILVAGFREEVAYYRAHTSEGYDEEGLARLREDCARVFLDSVAADLDAAEFAPVYAGAMHFDVLDGVRSSLEQLQALGLELAVVANWDLSLRKLLVEVGLDGYFSVIVHAAAKPAPDGFLRAIQELGVAAERVVHIGDDEVDETAARAAGVGFLAAPVSAAIAMLA